MPVGPEAHHGGKLLTAAEKVGTWLCSSDRGRGKTQVAPHMHNGPYTIPPINYQGGGDGLALSLIPTLSGSPKVHPGVGLGRVEAKGKRLPSYLAPVQILTLLLPNG